MKRYRTHLLVLGILVAASLSGIDRGLFHALTDSRFTWFPRAATGDVALVAIDARSIREIGVWPWPRSLHAELIEKLQAAGATDIAFDVDFSSHADAAGDAAFAEALRKADGSVILPSFVQHAPDQDGKATLTVTQPQPEFRDHSWPVTANFQTEPNGIARRYPFGASLNGTFVPSMGSMLAGVYDPKSADFRIDFSIDPDTVPLLPFVDVLAGRVPQSKIAGKKIIVGGTAVELGDRVNIPNGRIIPGPVFQALSAESLIQGRSLAQTGSWLAMTGLCLLPIIVSALWRRMSTRALSLCLVAVALAVEALATLLQVKMAILLDTSVWHIAIVAYLVTIGLYEFDFRGLMTRIAESRFRRIAMSIGDGLVCTDNSGIITAWNPGATQMFGFEDSQMTGMPFATVIAADHELDANDLGAFFRGLPDETASIVIELTGRRSSGEQFPLEASISRWKSTSGNDYGLILRDITARKREEERIRFLAGHDLLTGLANRAKVNDELSRLARDAEAGTGEIAVVLLGLDRFKDLNDTLGQDRGDAIIRAVAERLDSAASKKGLVARVSGDEFAVILPAREGKPVETLIADIAAGFASLSIDLDARTVSVTMSLGSAVFPHDGRSASDLMANASLALQDAKLHNRGGHVRYRGEIRSAIEEKRQLEKDLHRAFACGEFELHYQPQVALSDRRVVGAEALIRWNHPSRGMIAPAQFMPILNTMPLSADVGRWVIEQAVKQSSDWHKAGHNVRIGINLSPAQLTADGSLPEIVARALAANDLPHRLIELEVTENILLDDGEVAAGTIRRIRDMGIEIAFDDFGTGYASLTHLKRLPLDRLKIDQTFVRHLLTDQEDRAIVGALIGLGRLLDMHLIAEGVEDFATADALHGMGCEEAQGYAFGRAVSAAEFFALHLAQDSYETAKSDVVAAAGDTHLEVA